MEPFKVHILGCGSALPTAKHAASAQVVELRGKCFLVDCGEGTQLQMRRSHVSLTRLQAIFISHLHGDHCFGLMGLICTMGMLGRTAPLQVFAPAEMQPLFELQMKMFGGGLEYEVHFHSVDPSVQQVVYEDRSLTVETIPLEHRVPCCGYLFRERPTLPHIRRDMIDFYHIPKWRIASIKQGEGWVTPEGEEIPHQQLVKPADAPRAYAYCSDTRFVPTLHERLQEVDLLYHEATYDDAMAARAALYHHSTASQAARVAQAARVGQLLLGHFSARYDNEQLLLEQAQAIFPHTLLAHEGMEVSVLPRSNQISS